MPIFYSIYFPLYEFLKNFYAERIYNDPHKFNSLIYTLAAVSSGFICDFFTNPMWVVRIRYQTEFLHSGSEKMDSFNVWKSIAELYKKANIFNIGRILCPQ